VGCCRELLLGTPDESPRLGEGGIITPLANPTAIATAMHALLSNPARMASAGDTMKKRVDAYYNKLVIDRQYRKLYDDAFRAHKRERAA
jgi:glycosyltransferase involved in cell wall biosynthesis